MNRNFKNKVIVVAGPTASGKSALAIDLAEAFNGVIINADSMQIYQGTPVISAAPSEDDKKRVEHRLYEIFSPDVNGSVVDWLNLAVEEIKNCWAEGKMPIVVGGTGLYLDNLMQGTTPIPETSANVRQKVMQKLHEIGVNKLHEELALHDPITASRLSPNDTTRVRRAFEVWLQTGIPLSEWHQKPMIKKIPEARFIVVKILPSREELDERCFIRWDKMMEQGALKEIEELAHLHLDKNLPAMKALGVPELLAFVEGKMTFDEACNLAKLHTRQYAKRQMTWFRNKLKADVEILSCYHGLKNERENVILGVKKLL